MLSDVEAKFVTPKTNRGAKDSRPQITSRLLAYDSVLR
jgi:hypothetical protein